MPEHVCKWQAMTIREPVHQRGQFFFTCIAPDCPVGVLTAGQAEGRLNEYETLKAATERLSANMARTIGAHGVEKPEQWAALDAYADTLEGK